MSTVLYTADHVGVYSAEGAAEVRRALARLLWAAEVELGRELGDPGEVHRLSADLWHGGGTEDDAAHARGLLQGVTEADCGWAVCAGELHLR